jgi:pilus assembly protein CpaF
MDAMAAVESRVRDEVRARGIDPLRDPESVRDLVDEAIQRSLADGPLDDAAALGTFVFHSIAGFGPLQPYFDDPDVEELWINARLTYW